MDEHQHRLGETLPGTAGTYVVAAVVVLAVLGTGILLIAAAVRHEDAEIRVDAHAPDPFTRAVRRMLGLRVYSGADFPYGVPVSDPGAQHPQANDRTTYGAPGDPAAYGALTSTSYGWAPGVAAADRRIRTTRPGASRDELARLLASLAPEPPPGRKLVLAAVAPDVPNRAVVLAWVPLNEYQHVQEHVSYHGPASPNR